MTGPRVGCGLPSVRVRVAGPVDWSRLSFAVGLNRSPATRSLYLDWMPPGVDLLRALCADPERRPRVGLVAEARGRLIGFAGLDAHPDRGPEGIAGERTALRLLGPVVRRDHRRRGVGSLLLRRALAAGAVHYGGDREVLAVVDDGNRAAQRLLTGHGLRPGSREHCMIMTGPPPAAARTAEVGAGLRLGSGRDLADVERIYPIYRSAWPGRKARASFAADVRDPPGALWWLERDGGGRAGVIAFLQHVARPDGHDNIEYVAVHERLRGRGYGRRLLELALTELWRDPRLQSLRLSTAEDNLPALRLYLRMGFRRRFLGRYYEAPLRDSAARQARPGAPSSGRVRPPWTKT